MSSSLHKNQASLYISNLYNISDASIYTAILRAKTFSRVIHIKNATRVSLRKHPSNFLLYVEHSSLKTMSIISDLLPINIRLNKSLSIIVDFNSSIESYSLSTSKRRHCCTIIFTIIQRYLQ